MLQRENYQDVDTLDAADRFLDSPARPVRRYPSPMHAHARIGLLGALVDALEPHTESDPSALLIQGLVGFGNVIGRSARFVADGSEHYGNLFAVIVGTSSKGRKGTSWSRIKGTLVGIDPNWICREGLASGEGLIEQVRDPIQKSGSLDPGISDKRLLVVESELARVLKVMAREGATLSAILRQAWDSGQLASLARNAPLQATGAHVSLIGHITADELRRELTATDAANGFGNRFLWACAQRSKLLPDGGSPDVAILREISDDLTRAVQLARTRAELKRSPAAADLWRARYMVLSSGVPGLLGSLTSRAEAQVVRLSLLYALLDASPLIERRHLEAALEVWRYCFESARFIFGESLGDRIADAILDALRQAGPAGMTRTDLSRNALGGNRASHEITRALDLLQEHQLAHCEIDRSVAGPRTQHWYASPIVPLG